MTDRSKELRLLMKQKASDSKNSTSSSRIDSISNENVSLAGLSGKEKAKLLKMLKEKNKSQNEVTEPVQKIEDRERAVRPVKTVSIKSITETTKETRSEKTVTFGENITFPNDKKADAVSTGKQVLPMGFFDHDSDADESEKANESTTNTMKTSENTVSTNNDNNISTAISDYEYTPVSSSINTANDKKSSQMTAESKNSKQNNNLPAGFFDEAPISKQEENQSKLSNFFEELEQLPEVTDDSINEVTAEEEEMIEMEDTGLQRAYETRLAALYMTVARKKEHVDPSVFSDDTVHQALKEANDIIKHSIMGIVETSRDNDVIIPNTFRQSASSALGGMNTSIENESRMISDMESSARKRPRTEDDMIDDEDDMEEDGESLESDGKAENIDDFMDNIDWMSRTL